ncbi:MAG: transposase, partial [Limisphaerales bacterium]
MNNETLIKHKRYDEAFKRSSVEHWMVSGQSATVIAAELGTHAQNLHKWKQKFK